MICAFSSDNYATFIQAAGRGQRVIGQKASCSYLQWEGDNNVSPPEKFMKNLKMRLQSKTQCEMVRQGFG